MTEKKYQHGTSHAKEDVPMYEIPRGGKPKTTSATRAEETSPSMEGLIRECNNTGCMLYSTRLPGRLVPQVLNEHRTCRGNHSRNGSCEQRRRGGTISSCSSFAEATAPTPCSLNSQPPQTSRLVAEPGQSESP